MGVAVEAHQKEQIGHLKTDCVTADFLSQLYGIRWPPGEAFPDDYHAWESQRFPKQRCGGDLVSRWAAEFFMQDNRVQPLPWSAAGLGMTPGALGEVLTLLPKMGMRRNYAVYPGLIDKSLKDDLIRSLRGLRFRTFGTHDAFCELLHAAINEATGYHPERWLCATSTELAEYPLLYASQIDSILLQPLSTKHSVWLDLGKPLSLNPDRFSKLFYARHRDEMRQLLAGRGEPGDMDYYLQRLGKAGGQAHG